MPLLPNAKKALRSSKRKAAVNQVLKSKTRTLIKKAKLEPTAEKISAAYSALDKMVKKNLMHKNKAARVKSSLAQLKLEEKTDVKAKKAPAKATKKTASSKKAKEAVAKKAPPKKEKKVSKSSKKASSATKKSEKETPSDAKAK